MKIILGIGNPGKEYADTRHNAGFMVVERFAAAHRFGAWRRRFQSLAVEGTVAGRKLLLMKPQTYVNESGRALRAAVDWCGAEPSDIMVVVDDFNLPAGRLRVRAGGSSGGHHGLESIAAHMAGMEVARLRIGIGGGEVRCDRDYVLSRFTPAERKLVDEAVERAVRALEVWLKSGLERCMNEFNVRPATETETEQ